MEEGKKSIEHQTNSTSIDLQSTNLNSINLSYSLQHRTRLLGILQEPSSSEWNLILPITSTRLSHSTISNILPQIHKTIKKQTTIDSQLHTIRQVLKFIYTLQTSKADFKLEYEEWVTYMHLSITDYLVDHQLITLAHKSLEVNLRSFESKWIKAIFHLRIVLIFLEENNLDLDLVELHLAYAISLSNDHSMIKLECEVCSARLSFHQGKFIESFNRFSQLLEKNDRHHLNSRDYLITIQIISAMMIPPRLRQPSLQKVKESLTQPDFSSMQNPFEKILCNLIIEPHSEDYNSLASLLPESFISDSNETFKNSIRIHNLWSKSINPQNISSNELLILLDFQQPNELKRFLRKRNQIDQLNLHVFLSKDSKEDFYVQFNRNDNVDELDIRHRIENMSNKLSLLSTLPSNKQSLSESLVNPSVTRTITLSPDTSEHRFDKEKTDLMEIDQEMITHKKVLGKVSKKERNGKEISDTSVTHRGMKRKDQKRRMKTEEDLDLPAIRDSSSSSEPAIYDHSNQFNPIDSNHDDDLMNDGQMKSQEEEEEEEVDEIDLPAIPNSSPIINEENFDLNDDQDEEKSKRVNEIDLFPIIPDLLSSNINQANLVGLNHDQDDEKPAIIDEVNQENESLVNFNNEIINQTQEKNDIIVNALSKFSKALRSF